ncbi:MAG: single-stranded DNA-binding protein [Rothia sp. (in: high G+C Gram-positive bacteria)]|nr:single-stranded DNA-binding protein [Rothia sp. (in: high G+C Gram-positive bacteria)]
MTDTVTIRGFIATAPTQKFLPKGNTPVTNFRIASTPRWFDAASGTWKEGSTNWYTVNSFRALAYNSARSLKVGQPVLVTGRLRVKQFERSDGSPGTSIEVDATSIGHDLTYGLANFARVTDRKPDVDETDRTLNEQVSGEPAVHQGYDSLPPADKTPLENHSSGAGAQETDSGLTADAELDEAAVALTH